MPIRVVGVVMLAVLSVVGMVLAVTPAFVASQDRLELLQRAEAELAASPADVKVIVRASVARKMAGYYEDSLRLLRSCDAVNCKLTIAFARAMTDDANEALPFLEKRVALKQPTEHKASALVSQSEALLRVGRPDDAVTAARKAIAEIDAPKARLRLAIALFAAGKLDEAELELDALLVTLPTQEVALFWKYRCLKQRGDAGAKPMAKKALDGLSEAVAGPLQERGDLHFLLAEVATELGHGPLAKKHRDTAMRLHVTSHWFDRTLLSKPPPPP